MANIKLSVFIVCYNQESYIAQAIDSVLNQRVLPYEIVISDDHSTDNTWGIIEKYSNEYPELVKAYRNEANLGIYKNVNKATHLVTGNLVTCVAGDDYINPGYFEAISKYIEEKALNPETERFLIVSDIVKLLDGLEIKYNNHRFSGRNIRKLSLREIVDDRYGIVSIALLKAIPEFIEDIGIYADLVWNMERYIKTDKVYFMEGYYPVYRIGVGVVSRSKEIDVAESQNKALEIIIQRFRHVYARSELRYIAYLQRKNNYKLNKNLRNYFSLVYATLFNIGNFCSWKKQLKSFIYILLPKKFKKTLFKLKYFELLST